eukprot:scaffold464_cov181-Amphora_coffeaeformis.AAC.8
MFLGCRGGLSYNDNDLRTSAAVDKLDADTGPARGKRREMILNHEQDWFKIKIFGRQNFRLVRFGDFFFDKHRKERSAMRSIQPSGAIAE